jgi:FAD/FMN-containing dehydrogenase
VVREVITNYDGGITTAPQVVARPEGVADLQAIMADPRRFPPPVRPMGSFHSLTPCVSSPGTIVSMANLDRVVEVDAEGLTFTAQAGMQHIRAAEVLRDRGLQFKLNVEIGNMTLGSAACCHTKDALDCVEYGQLSSYVTGMRWVTPSGELGEASTESDPELMPRMRSSYGLAGIVYEATFRVAPLRIVRFDYHLRRLPDLTQDDVGAVIRDNDSMVCWTIGDTVVVQTCNRADALRRHWLAGVRRKGWNFVGAYVGKGLRRYVPIGAVRTALEDVWFAVQRTTYRGSAAVGGLSLYDPDKIVNYEDTPSAARYAFTFWAFPLYDWVRNLKEYQEFSRQHYERYGFRCNMPLGSYYIKQDRSSLLSYTHDGDILSLDPIHAPSEVDHDQWMQFLDRFNDWAHRRGGIPLLNQSPLVQRAHVQAAYGDRWATFSDWVRGVDPERRLQNEFFSDLLTPAG